MTQQDLHIHNLTELVEMVEAEGLRDRAPLVCGGPRISDELAKELGFDAGLLARDLPQPPGHLPRARHSLPGAADGRGVAQRGCGMSATLAGQVMPARRVTLVGLAKNTGKTEALTTLAAEMPAQGAVARRSPRSGATARRST